MSSSTNDIFIYSLPQSTPVFPVLEKSLQAVQNNYCFRHYKIITFCLVFSITCNRHVCCLEFCSFNVLNIKICYHHTEFQCFFHFRGLKRVSVQVLLTVVKSKVQWDVTFDGIMCIPYFMTFTHVIQVLLVHHTQTHVASHMHRHNTISLLHDLAVQYFTSENAPMQDR